MRVQFIFRNDAVAHAIGVRQLDVKVGLNFLFRYLTVDNLLPIFSKDIECDEPLALVYTMHAFYVTRVFYQTLKRCLHIFVSSGNGRGSRILAEFTSLIKKIFHVTY
jgi:hypothetical protein